MSETFPFTAVIGQESFKRALLLNTIDPGIGGVLAMGDRGTAKSTLVRSLADLIAGSGSHSPVVDLPLGATEDRVVGSLDVDAALARGEFRFRPGLLADAHEGFLYIDEVNLLDDHLVDLLLDVAAGGVNRVEREGVSHSHPARFVLVGSGNPEEGELRPQLEDRFGLSTFVSTLRDVATRTAIVRARLAFDADPVAFRSRYAARQSELGGLVAAARSALPDVRVPDRIVEKAVEFCVAAEAVGHRAEIVLVRAARASAALHGRTEVLHTDLAEVMLPALRHRIPRDPFEPAARVNARLTNTIRAVTGGPVAA
ncbi:AAA domain-containing protein [Rhodococcus triatomae]|uniref:Magnesium chelatase subunit I n=1 Tax=Rhodococcus triatomae TaxID=300028 RepID=A0A1G8CHC8_9NOCA|nr:AAA family ATPase [Rhodococcus triatomae]QNG18653.1 AAA domain-containing protein [Rhodococcus triatomae]QNG21677.1 AAA domain-containing protein [Rhodococcus triatomae]SDH44867.1 magnesium chelatase subunit I [Rhodococcus triatomae]